MNASWLGKAPIREERAEIGPVALTKLAFSAFQKPNPKNLGAASGREIVYLLFESKPKKMNKLKYSKNGLS